MDGRTTMSTLGGPLLFVQIQVSLSPWGDGDAVFCNLRRQEHKVLGSHTLVDGWSGPQHASVHALLAKCYPDSTNSLSALCGKHQLKKHFGQLQPWTDGSVYFVYKFTKTNSL